MAAGARTPWLTAERARAREILKTETYSVTADILNREFWQEAQIRTKLSVRGQVLHNRIDRPAEIQGDGPKEKTEFAEEGNYATAELKTLKNATTLNDLLEACEVDLDIWEVEKWVANKWPVTMKFGAKGDEEAIQIQQYQIKAWLIRKVPIKHEWPVIQPVKLSRPLTPRFKPARQGYPTVLIIPDSQNGYWRDMRTGYLKPMHDRRAWDLVLQVAHRMKPDRIVLLGDMLDLSEWTDKFVKSPEFYFTTQVALKELFWWLTQLADTGAQIDYLEGNHENRLWRAIVKNMIAGYQLNPANQPDAPAAMSVENLLSLKDLGIQYHKPYPGAHIWLNDNLRVSHGDVARKRSGATVKEMLQDARNSEVAAHSHRLEMAGITVHPHKGPRTYVVYNLGTLARQEQGVVPSSGGRQNWQQGFGTGWYQIGGDHLFEIYPHPIYGGQIMYQGCLLKARQNLSQLAAEATGVAELIKHEVTE